jgi:hypothetical protein
LRTCWWEVLRVRLFKGYTVDAPHAEIRRGPERRKEAGRGGKE